MTEGSSCTCTCNYKYDLILFHIQYFNILEQYKNNAANTDQTFYNSIFIGFDYFLLNPHCGEIYDGFIWILGCTMYGKGKKHRICSYYLSLWRLKVKRGMVTSYMYVY